MTGARVAIIGVVLPWLLAAVPAPAPAREPVAFVDVTVVDVVAGALRPRQTVVVAAGRISAAGRRRKLPCRRTCAWWTGRGSF